MSAPALATTPEADLPPLRRDAVRLLVVPLPGGAPSHSRFGDLPALLAPGDLVVVNTSATLPAALGVVRPDGAPAVLHLSGPDPARTGAWVVELRAPDPRRADELVLVGGGRVTLLAPYHGSRRLWTARLDLPLEVERYLARHGHPIRYAHAAAPEPLAAYQTVYATEAGSAEMPSAGRPFTPEVITRLVAKGVDVAPLVLHTGVSSLERDERPYPERFSVSEGTAERANLARRLGGRVVAVGTTVARALESAADEEGVIRSADGWTDLELGPERPARVLDGLLTGFHDPGASHVRLLEAVAGRAALTRAYDVAAAAGYRRHEWGDVALFLADRRST